MPIPDDAEMRQSLTKLSNALQSFAQSPETFRIITSLPRTSTQPQPTTLYILDSSFNPPTRAHLRIATTALKSVTPHTPSRLLLLLATQNADKAATPASFPHRLMMMNLFAQDLLGQFNNNTNPPNHDSSSELSGNAVNTVEEETKRSTPGIDIAITKLPYFIDKSASIANSNHYPSNPTQIHLIGYDTLLRLFDTKYYPPTQTLAPLTEFLSQHKLHVTLRTDDAWGDRSAQEAYVKGIGAGSLEGVGGKREWGSRIELVSGREEGEEVVSSTRVREAVKTGNEGLLKSLVTDGVASYIFRESLYVEN